MTDNSETHRLDIEQIRDLLPHRYPFLLLDKVSDYKSGEYIHAQKNVSINEPFFQGHFPGKAVMPGVLIIEALAQAAGLLAHLTADEHGGIYYLAGVDKARFKKPVVPGDQLQITVQITRRVKSIWKYSAQATVDGELVASAELLSGAGA